MIGHEKKILNPVCILPSYDYINVDNKVDYITSSYTYLYELKCIFETKIVCQDAAKIEPAKRSFIDVLNNDIYGEIRSKALRAIHYIHRGDIDQCMAALKDIVKETT